MSDQPENKTAVPDVFPEPSSPLASSGGYFKNLRRDCFWLALICIPAIIWLGVYAIPAARESARYTSCISNLKQMGIALHNYHAEYGQFPPAYTVDSEGKPLHSWRTLILPFSEMGDLYNQLRLDEPWSSEHNLAVFKKIDEKNQKTLENGSCDEFLIPDYRCPSAPEDRPVSYTSYAMVVGPDCVSDGPTSCSIDELVNGSSNTILIVETTAPIRWYEPKDIDIGTLAVKTNPDEPAIGSFHPERFYGTCCSGNTCGFKKEVLEKDPTKLRTMLEGRKKAPRPTRPD